MIGKLLVGGVAVVLVVPAVAVLAASGVGATAQTCISSVVASAPADQLLPDNQPQDPNPTPTTTASDPTAPGGGSGTGCVPALGAGTVQVPAGTPVDVATAVHNALAYVGVSHGWSELCDKLACRAYGYSFEEMLKLEIDAFSAGYAPYTGKEAAGYLARAAAGQVQRFEWHRRNRDGSLHWDEVMLKRTTIGGVERILGITREISERKAAEQALRASEQQYRAIVSTALDSIISTDANGCVLAFNPAAERCFGYSLEAVIGQPVTASAMMPDCRLGPSTVAMPSATTRPGSDWPISVMRIRSSSIQRGPTVASVATIMPMAE